MLHYRYSVLYPIVLYSLGGEGLKKFFKNNINKIAIVIIAINLFIYTLFSTTAYADDFVDKPVVTTPSTDLSVVMAPVMGPQQITSEIFSQAAEDLVLWETGKLNDILDEQIGADDVLKDYYDVYYDLLLNDYQNYLEKYCSGSSKFNSDGSFLEEYTNAYYRHYFKSLYQFSEPFDWDTFIGYANERHKSEVSGDSTDTSSYIKKRGVKTRFSAPSFKRFVDEHSTYYEPTGSTNKVSWKRDKYFSNSSYDDARSASYFTFLDKHNFFGISGLKKCYMVPYFENGDDLYFSNYCLYFELSTQITGSSGSSEIYDMLFKYVDLHNTVSDLSDPVQYLSEFEKNSYKFSDFSGVEDEGGARKILNERLYSAFMAPHNLRFFDTFDHFLVYSYLNALSFPFPDEFDPMDKFYNSRNITLTVSDVFNEINFPACPLSEAPCDWGFIISDTPILMDGMGADIDTTKIPDNYYITVNGDTIYDYSITNPETGQSSTVNEYITNNYTYITNNNPGGEGGGSGTTGGNVGVNGNVNVGGEVKFGGEVNVGVDVSPIDVNVNVSGAGESGNVGGDPPEIGAVDDLVDYLPEKSPVISEYLKIFFDTLPPELLALILAGVAVAIIKLIFRR